MCYWFEKARAHDRAGQGQARRVCWRRRASGAAPTAWCWSASSRPATSSGPSPTATGCWMARRSTCRWSASMMADEQDALDGRLVPEESTRPDGPDRSHTSSKRLLENAGLAFMGHTRRGPFDIRCCRGAVPCSMRGQTRMAGRTAMWCNPLGQWQDITSRPRGMWIIDFGLDMPLEEAALYEAAVRVRRSPRQAGAQGQ